MTEDVELMRLADDGNPHTEAPAPAARACSRCEAFIWAPESLAGGLCLGCRSPAPAMRFERTRVLREEDGEAD